MPPDNNEDIRLLVVRLDERLNQVLRGLEQDRESRKAQYEKQEELKQELISMGSRLGQVEQSLTKQAPTIEEFITIKHKVVGAGMAGKWVWAILGGIISFLFTMRAEIITWLGKH